MDNDRGDFGMPMIGNTMKDAPFVGDDEVIGDDGEIKRTDEVSRTIDMPNYSLRVTQDGIDLNYGENGLRVPAVTPEARYILAKDLPRLLEEFLENNAKYARAQSGHDLGLKGVIPDINRKTSVLIDRLWFDRPDVGRDSNREIIGDLIGHLLLMLGKMGVGDER